MTTLEIQAPGGPWKAVPIVADQDVQFPDPPERIGTIGTLDTRMMLVLGQAALKANDVIKAMSQSDPYRGGKAARRMRRAGRRA